MATGAVFQIVTNDGKQDRMLMATALLNKRLQLIQAARAADPMVQDSTPTLVDIEKTHILFMNAHFKPFAAMGYEYNKVTPQSSASSLGTDVTFSIPQFGDFFGDMVVRASLNAPTISYSSTFGLSDTNTSLVGAQHAAAFRWCHYPGERLLQKVAFTVNGNALDQYTPLSVNFHREFRINDEQLRGWNRCMAQETPYEGFLRQPGVDLTGTTTASTGLVNAGAAPVSHRVAARVCDGPQTPKRTPDAIECWIPLLFWFNQDPRLVIPSVCIPFGQRFITLTLATAAQMYGLVPRGVSTWAAPNASLTAPTSDISKLELYINNIFVNPEVHDIFIKRVGFTLIRVHREQTFTTTVATDTLLMSNMKWPIECIFVGMRVLSRANANANLFLDQWHTFCSYTPTSYAMSQVLSGQGCTALTGTAHSIATTGISTGTGSAYATELALGDTISIAGHIATVIALTSATSMLVSPAPAFTCVGDSAVKLATARVEVQVPTRTVDSLTLAAHGIPLYNNIDSPFYSQYLPLAYSSSLLSCPRDSGAMLVNFSLYTGAYQPSGHLNASRAREFYITFASSVINSSVSGQLCLSAYSINFLLVSDGSAVLRYST